LVVKLAERGYRGAVSSHNALLLVWHHTLPDPNTPAAH